MTSILTAQIGLQWWAAPRTYPFGPGDDHREASLLAGLEAEPAAGVAGLVAALGLLAVWGLRRPVPSGWAIVLAASQAIVLGYVVPDITVLILLAYGIALLSPVGAVALLAVGSWRRPRLRPWAGAVVLAAVAAGVATEVASPATLADLGRGLGDGFGDIGDRPLYVVGSLAAGALWTVITVRAVRCRWPEVGRPRPERVARWSRVVTWAAALCAVPYAGLRLTWLTPWPMGIADDDLADQPEIRLFGLLLGLAALGGAWLTLGLASRWGEVFPGWIPVLRGRPVPVAAAVAPGLTVAAALTVAGRSMLQHAVWWEIVVVPFPVWGPLLGAATLAYWWRRRESRWSDPEHRLSAVPEPEGGRPWQQMAPPLRS